MMPLNAYVRWSAAALVLAVSAALLWGGWTAYRMNTSRAQALDAWVGVETEFQRRATLVPRIAAAVTALRPNETELAQSLAKTRAAVAGLVHDPQAPFHADRFWRFMRTQDALSVALGRALDLFNALADPAAKDRVRELRDDLALSETRIATARADYVTAASAYNERLTTVPGRWVAAALYETAVPMVPNFEGAAARP